MLRNNIQLQPPSILSEVLSVNQPINAIPNEERDCLFVVPPFPPESVNPSAVLHSQKIPLVTESDQESVLSCMQSGPCANSPQPLSQTCAIKSKPTVSSPVEPVDSRTVLYTQKNKTSLVAEGDQESVLSPMNLVPYAITPQPSSHPCVTKSKSTVSSLSKPVYPPTVVHIQKSKTPLSIDSSQDSILPPMKSGPCAINVQPSSQPSVINSKSAVLSSSKPASQSTTLHIEKSKTPLSTESNQESVLSVMEPEPCAINSQLTSQPSFIKSKESKILSCDSSKQNIAISQDCSSSIKDLQSVNDTLHVSPGQNFDGTEVPLEECDDIIILPTPSKPNPPIITIDDEDATVNQGTNTCTNGRKKRIKNETKKGPSIFEGKKFPAHLGLVNCIVVFEDYIYTCSNDHTAKRFNLQDVNQTVTYQHAAKNVKEIIVEKVFCEVIVFTSDSKNGISMFKASSGERITSFTHYCTISNICKGWGKIYSGWTDGSIHAYSWIRNLHSPLIKIVRTKTPISCIATTPEGHLPFLIVLSTDGKIYLRGAESGIVIRCINATVTLPPCLTIHKNLAHFRNSENTISIFNFLSKKVERTVPVKQCVTGIAVDENYVFTIVANCGLVNCYQLEGNKCGTNKFFYGSGKRNLSCIYVYQNWVITGSVSGNVYAYDFNPDITEQCKYRSCYSVFCSKPDLAFHIKNDHLPQQKILKCQWLKCSFKFKKNNDVEVKMRHIKTHIY